MRPSRVYASAAVNRTLAATGLDVAKLRERTRLSGGANTGRVPDAEFEDRIVSACNLIEQQTGLLLFPSTYEAEFDLADLMRNGSWASSALEVPGVNASITGVAAEGTAVEPRKLIPSGFAGGQSALPPFAGWPIQTWREPPVVTFTAGGSIPTHVVAAIASQARMEALPSPQEAQLLDYYLARIRVFV